MKKNVSYLLLFGVLVSCARLQEPINIFPTETIKPTQVTQGDTYKQSSETPAEAMHTLATKGGYYVTECQSIPIQTSDILFGSCYVSLDEFSKSILGGDFSNMSVVNGYPTMMYVGRHAIDAIKHQVHLFNQPAFELFVFKDTVDGKTYAAWIPISRNSLPAEIPEPTWVTLGSPFEGCGDGQPRVLFDNAFNGVNRMELQDPKHGHLDLFPPIGCDVYLTQGEITAPFDGKLYRELRSINRIYYIDLPPNTYLLGTDKVLKNAGLTDFKLTDILYTRVVMGHFSPLSIAAETGPVPVQRGESIGDYLNTSIDDPDDHNPLKVEFHVYIGLKDPYEGGWYVKEYDFSPNMFLQETGQPLWLCIGESLEKGNEACVLEYNHYP